LKTVVFILDDGTIAAQSSLDLAKPDRLREHTACMIVSEVQAS